MVYLTNGNKLNKFSQCFAFVPSLLNKKCLLINAISPTRNNTSCISYKFLHLHMENLIKIIKYKLRNTLTSNISTHILFLRLFQVNNTDNNILSNFLWIKEILMNRCVFWKLKSFTKTLKLVRG